MRTNLLLLKTIFILLYFTGLSLGQNNGLISPPVASSITKCSPGSATLRASGCTGTYNWYTASSGGSSLGTGASYTTPSLSTRCSSN